MICMKGSSLEEPPVSAEDEGGEGELAHEEFLENPPMPADGEDDKGKRPPPEELIRLVQKEYLEPPDGKELFAEQCQRWVLPIVGKILGGGSATLSSDYEDVAQEVVLKAWLNLSSFRGESSLRTWASRIAVNRALEYFRRANAGARDRNRTLYMEDMFPDESDGKKTFDLPDGGITPEMATIREERAALIRKAIERALSPEERDAIILHEVEGIEIKRIAEMLGGTEGAMKSRISRARMKLRDYLERRGITTASEGAK